MANKSFQRSIRRFTKNERDADVEKAGITPGSFVRKARRSDRGRRSPSLWRRPDAETGRTDRADLPRRQSAHVPEAGETRRIRQKNALRQGCRRGTHHPDQGARGGR